MSVAASYRLERGKFALQADIDIPTRGITGLFGPSGSGKTTVLRCMAGLEQPASGKLIVNGEVWQDTATGINRGVHERRIGYVFQEPRLFSHLNVRRNLDYGRQRAADQSGVDFEEIINLLGIELLLDRSPTQLSGGEAQRVAIARALLRDPALVLMDEPLGALDQDRRDEILPFFDRLHAELALPIVYVSHSMEEICRLCDYLVVMQDGSVAASDSIQSLLVRDDVGSLVNEESGSIIDGVIEGYDVADRITSVRYSAGVLFVTGQPGQETDRVRLRIKSNDVSLCREEPRDSTILNIVPAIVEHIQETNGAHALVRLVLGQDRITARVSYRSLRKLDIQVGQDLYCQIKAVSVRAAGAADAGRA